MSSRHPIEILHHIAGAPTLQGKKPSIGTCAITGTTTDIIPLKRGLPTSFNSLELIPHRGESAGVSAAMQHVMDAWGTVRSDASNWRDSGLMAISIDDDNITRWTRWEGDEHPINTLVDHLAELLAAGHAVVAPTTRKRHAALWATRGMVATEQGPMAVSRRVIDGIKAVREAKALGISETELRDSSPTFRAVGLAGSIAAAQAIWTAIRPLQATPLVLDLALIWGRQPKPKEVADATT